MTRSEINQAIFNTKFKVSEAKSLDDIEFYVGKLNYLFWSLKQIERNERHESDAR